MRARFEAGFAVRSITPRGPIEMAGYASRQGRSVGVNDDLASHAVVVSDGLDVAAVVSLDLLEVSEELVDRIRAEAERRTRLPGSGIMVCATHTHSGPVVSEGFGQQPDPEYLQFVVRQSVDAIAEAWATRGAVTVRTGSGDVKGLAYDRRTLEPSPDPQVSVIGFFRGTRLVGSMVGFALHPTVLGPQNLLVSADWPGYLRTSIARRRQGCLTVFINGAAGNVNIGYSADESALGKPMSFRTFETARRVGESVANAALEALERGVAVEAPRVEVRTRRVALPLRQLPSARELAERAAAGGASLGRVASQAGASAEARSRLRAIYDECLSQVMRRLGINGQTALTVSIQAVRIGTAVLVGIPAELFVQAGITIKRCCEGYRVWVAGYANGSAGYLPTEEAFGAGGYEVETSVFAESAAGVLVEEVCALVNSFQQPGPGVGRNG